MDRVFTGKDLDDALRAASRALGAPAADLRYEVLEEGRRGVFGLGSRRVRIRADRASGAPVAARAEFDADASWAEMTARKIFALMGLEVDVLAGASAEGVRLEVAGPDTRHLVAREGEVLSAVEFLLNRMGRQSRPAAGRIRLDCEGYRDHRDEEVVALVREVAAQVLRTGEPKRLHAMNSYERRLVHVTVQEFAGLTTRSIGAGLLKRVEVRLAEPKGRA